MWRWKMLSVWRKLLRLDLYPFLDLGITVSWVYLTVVGFKKVGGG